ncbi:uncharacterized protein BCR38DRAFT_435604 [Pseudomassariella vexata]|uniref:Peptidase S54 rhomboid domain-containing protein n=1 Tax=Pseudomassariella vexata TaxID=1141098 RepID=A0A1Y2DUX7_9PEZI|nr:uncharacterized protein BCR38DRAFT_435604 [Pseudomassariella vexata]ORY62989.1 hypothetical protein BCR38DRAFT_435604 [Pseudomassariella vexata]
MLTNALHRLATRSLRASKPTTSTSPLSDGAQRSKSFFTPSHRPSPSPRLPLPLIQGLRRSYYNYNPNYHHTSLPVQKGVIFGFIGLNAFICYEWNFGPSSSHTQTTATPTGASLFHDMNANFILSQHNLDSGRWWTLLTHSISHQELPHLVFNMVSFHAFASSFFMIGLGPGLLCGVMLGSALVAGLTGLADNRRKEQDRGGLGASGIVTGLGAFVTCIAPNLRFMILPFPFGIPLWILTPGYFAYDWYRADDPNSRVGHAAHIGGSCFGVLAFVVRKMLRL